MFIRILWNDLLHLNSSMSTKLWFLCGDFNAILNLEEVVGRGSPDTQSMTEFLDFIAQIDLRELPTVGGYFIWSGVWRNGHLWRKLDRYLFSYGFRIFLTARLSCLTVQPLIITL